jgi:hypothetical protein
LDDDEVDEDDEESDEEHSELLDNRPGAEVAAIDEAILIEVGMGASDVSADEPRRLAADGELACELRAAN